MSVAEQTLSARMIAHCLDRAAGWDQPDCRDRSPCEYGARHEARAIAAQLQEIAAAFGLPADRPEAATPPADPNPWRSLCAELLTTLDHVAGALPCIGVERSTILKAIQRDSAAARQRLDELDNASFSRGPSGPSAGSDS